MRALTFVGPGKLEWREAPDPVLRGPGEAIVRRSGAARAPLHSAAP